MNGGELSLLHRSARKYVEVFHYPVFPLRGKEPLVKGGFHSASRDLAQVDEWWTRWPNANIGIPTGKETFDVVDIDPRNGGDKSLERLTDKHGPMLRETRQQITGGGGRHYCTTGGLLPHGAHPAPGIDIQSDGGYIVAAPSIHPDTGRAYEWDGMDNLENQPLLPPPDWLVELCRQKKHRVDHKIPDVVADGVKHDTIVSLCGTMVERNFPKQAAFAACRAMNFQSPVSDEDIWKHVEDVYRRYVTARKPRPGNVVVDQLKPNLDLLNAMTVFENRIRFEAVQRRGPLIVASTNQGEIIWPAVSDLSTFSRSQSLIADCTNIFLSTPAHGYIRASWEPAARLLLQLAAVDGIQVDNACREECRDLLRLMWRQSGQPTATNNQEFIGYMRAALNTPRDPRGPVPPCVFIAEEYAWVHVPSFRSWLSTPALTNRLYPLADIRNGLLLLGFTYHENLTRRDGKDAETACLWSGPLDVLGKVMEVTDDSPD